MVRAASMAAMVTVMNCMLIGWSLDFKILFRDVGLVLSLKFDNRWTRSTYSDLCYRDSGTFLMSLSSD